MERCTFAAQQVWQQAIEFSDLLCFDFDCDWSWLELTWLDLLVFLSFYSRSSRSSRSSCCLCFSSHLITVFQRIVPIFSSYFTCSSHANFLLENNHPISKSSTSFSRKSPIAWWFFHFILGLCDTRRDYVIWKGIFYHLAQTSLLECNLWRRRYMYCASIKRTLITTLFRDGVRRSNHWENVWSSKSRLCRPPIPVSLTRFLHLNICYDISHPHSLNHDLETILSMANKNEDKTFTAFVLVPAASTSIATACHVQQLDRMTRSPSPSSGSHRSSIQGTHVPYVYVRRAA